MYTCTFFQSLGVSLRLCTGPCLEKTSEFELYADAKPGKNDLHLVPCLPLSPPGLSFNYITELPILNKEGSRDIREGEDKEDRKQESEIERKGKRNTHLTCCYSHSFLNYSQIQHQQGSPGRRESVLEKGSVEMCTLTYVRTTSPATHTRQSTVLPASSTGELVTGGQRLHGHRA